MAEIDDLIVILSFRIEQIRHKFERLFVQFVSSTFLIKVESLKGISGVRKQ